MKKHWAAVLLTLVMIAATVFGYRAWANQQPNQIVYYPAETDDVLLNPYMGWVGDARETEMQQPVTLVFAKMSWREIEPEPGQYAFAAFEERNRFQHWAERNVKIVLRLYLDYPREADHLDIPDWLYEKIGGDGTHYDIEHGKGFSPDYTNPVLIREHKRLIRAVGERYNQDPRIAFVQLGSVGHWGEWHTWDEEDGHIPFPQRKIADQYVQPYIDYFSNKHLLMRRPMQIAADNGMGLYNDAFGKTESTVEGFADWFTNGYKSWLTGEQEPAMPQFWTTAPSGGEFSNPAFYLKDENIEETLRQARLTHISWLGPNSPVKEPRGGPLQQNMDRLLKTMGYRFVLSSAKYEEFAKPGGSLNVEVQIVNRGVAPFYFPWEFELSLTDAEGRVAAAFPTGADIRQWLPGETAVQATLEIPDSLSPGVYTLTAAIMDPGTGRPGIQFANEGRLGDGRYVLGTVEIVS